MLTYIPRAALPALSNSRLMGVNPSLPRIETGPAIARNRGQLRFEILVDENGTPNDPSDDEITRLGMVKGSTGRSDDFCGAVVPALS